MVAGSKAPYQQQLLQYPPAQQTRSARGSDGVGSGRGRGQTSSLERKHLQQPAKGSTYGSALGKKATAEAPDESTPSKRANFQSWPDFLRWLETSEDTDPAHLLSWCCDEFKPRKLKAPLVLGWLVFQLFGLGMQLTLYSEIGGHLYDYETTFAAYCGPEHQQHGVCLGPSWNLSYSSVLTFPPSMTDSGTSDFDFIIPSDQAFSFETASSPPTFLVGVEPQSPNNQAQWKASLRTSGGGMDGSLSQINGVGSKYKVISEKSHRFFVSARHRWTGSLSLRANYAETVQIHVYVVDSRIQHLEDIHKQKQCSFEDSWMNFNERHNGEHHKVLTYTKLCIGFFAVLSVCFSGLLLYRFFMYVEGGKLLSRIIALKFLLQDIPQQLCIVAYLYGWYAANGLRCQMCLFHPAQCDNEHPLHMANLTVAVFTMVSACSNQMLVQAKLRGNRDEEDECFLWFVRFSLLSVSILPLTTAVVILSASLLHFRSVLVYILFGVPMLLGWGSCLFVPLVALCDDDDF